MSKRLMFIFNPRSGKGKIRSVLLDIVDTFTKSGYDVTVYPTQSQGDCARKICEACELGYDMAVISGGDGTINEAVCGILNIPVSERIPMGYIPAGTMNDFASGNGISKTMVDAACEIMSGQRNNYDIGSFNDESFIYVAAFGAFTDVSYDTPQSAKNLFGSAAYFWEGIKRIPKIEGVRVKVQTDEGEEICEEVYWCFLMNSTSVAGFDFGDFYDINANDGLFELVLIPKSTNIKDIATIINDIRMGKRGADGVRVISTSGAIISTEKPVRWTLDGEFGGETDTVRFKVLHNAVQFVFNSEKSKNLSTENK